MAKNKANETISDVNLLFEVPNKESQKILPAGLWILASILEGVKYTFEKNKYIDTYLPRFQYWDKIANFKTRDYAKGYFLQNNQCNALTLKIGKSKKTHFYIRER